VVLICGFAFLKGEEPERLAAGAYVLGWLTSMLIQDSTDPTSGYRAWLVIIDVVILGVLVGLTWKAKRAWPAWAAACQLLVVMSHLVGSLDARMTRNDVITVVNMAGYGVLVALGIGTFWAWQERRAANIQ